MMRGVASQHLLVGVRVACLVDDSLSNRPFRRQKTRSKASRARKTAKNIPSDFVMVPPKRGVHTAPWIMTEKLILCTVVCAVKICASFVTSICPSICFSLAVSVQVSRINRAWLHQKIILFLVCQSMTCGIRLPCRDGQHPRSLHHQLAPQRRTHGNTWMKLRSVMKRLASDRKTPRNVHHALWISMTHLMT